MRAAVALLVLAGFLLVSLPSAAADEGNPEPTSSADCIPWTVDPPKFEINPPCVAANVAAVLPQPAGSIFLCTFNGIWGALGPQQSSSPTTVVDVVVAPECVPG